MEKKSRNILVFFTCSLIFFIFFTQLTYNTEYRTNEIKEEIKELDNQKEEIKLKITSEASREEIQQNNSDLSVNNNVYYLEEEDDEEK